MTPNQSKKKTHFRMNGPDGGWAWCVALAVCLITFIMQGLARMSGVLYVAFIHNYDISRMEAAVPFSIRSSVKNLLGPLVGILGQQYGVKAVVLAGGIVATISASACFFAYNMLLVTVLWGALNGIGCALTITLLQVMIGQHFKKYHSTASGLAFSGGCVGAFLFPALIELLLNNFGLEGAFLVLAGIIMNTIPAAMVLRKPAWIKNTPARKDGVQTIENLKKNVLTPNSIKDASKANEKSDKKGGSASGIESHSENKSLREIEQTLKKDLDDFYWLRKDKATVAEVVYKFLKFFDTEDDLIRAVRVAKGYSKASDPLNDLLSDMFNEICMYDMLSRARNLPTEGRDNLGYVENEIGLEVDCQQSRKYFAKRMNRLIEDSLLSCRLQQMCNGLADGLLKNENMVRSILLEVQDACRLCNETGCSSGQKEVILNIDEKASGNKSTKGIEPKSSQKKPGFRDHIKTLGRLNGNPFFLLVCFCRTVHYMTVLPFTTVIVDFSKDKGIPEDYGKYVIAALSAGDLFGRLCLGWVTDKKYLSLPKFMLLSMVAQGAATAALPLVTSTYPLMLLITVFGMLQGSVFIRHPVLIKKYISSNEQAIAIGSINFFWGIIGFTQPLYIGYFRDTLGSYDMMFYITAFVETMVGLCWIFEPHLAKFVPVKKEPAKYVLGASEVRETDAATAK